MSKRKPGWYWVKDGEGWKCAEWRESAWHVGWARYATSDFPFDEIGRRVPAPSEPWQCVPKYEPTEAMLFKAEVEAKSKEVDMGAPWPTEHPDDGGGVAGAYYRGLLAAAPSPDES